MHFNCIVFGLESTSHACGTQLVLYRRMVMKTRTATIGQIRQLDKVLLNANPTDELSFEEAKCLLRDENLVDEIRSLLRKHKNSEPVRVVPASSPLQKLARLCEGFEPYDEGMRSHKSTPISKRGDRERPDVFAGALDIFMSSAPAAESFLEVISFKDDKTNEQIAAKLAGMGYRSADLQEAVGFLQARGKTFCNAGRSPGVGVHGFLIMSEKKLAQFYRYSEGGWRVAIGWLDYRKDILVAKL